MENIMMSSNSNDDAERVDDGAAVKDASNEITDVASVAETVVHEKVRLNL